MQKETQVTISQINGSGSSGLPVREGSSASAARPARAAAEAASTKGEEKRPPPARAAVEQAVESIARFVQPVLSSLEFRIDDDTGQVIVRVLDGSTKEVIRQIPSEEVVAMARALDKLQGLLVDRKA